MGSNENLNGLFNNALKEYSKAQKSEDWLKRQVKELFSREGYETIGDEDGVTVYANSINTIKIYWSSETK